MKWYHQMQNKIKNFLLILGLFLFAKLLLIPILLFIEIINISRLSNIFNFVFDYALFGTAFFLGFCKFILFLVVFSCPLCFIINLTDILYRQFWLALLPALSLIRHFQYGKKRYLLSYFFSF